MSKRNLKTESKKHSYICKIDEGSSTGAYEGVSPETLLVAQAREMFARNIQKLRSTTQSWNFVERI